MPEVDTSIYNRLTAPPDPFEIPGKVLGLQARQTENQLLQRRLAGDQARQDALSDAYNPLTGQLDPGTYIRGVAGTPGALQISDDLQSGQGVAKGAVEVTGKRQALQIGQYGTIGQIFGAGLQSGGKYGRKEALRDIAGAVASRRIEPDVGDLLRKTLPRDDAGAKRIATQLYTLSLPNGGNGGVKQIGVMPPGSRDANGNDISGAPRFGTDAQATTEAVGAVPGADQAPAAVVAPAARPNAATRPAAAPAAAPAASSVPMPPAKPKDLTDAAAAPASPDVGADATPPASAAAATPSSAAPAPIAKAAPVMGYVGGLPPGDTGASDRTAAAGAEQGNVLMRSADTAPTQRARLQQMQADLDYIETGPGASEWNKAKSGVNYALNVFNVPKNIRFNEDAVARAENFKKLSSQLIADQQQALGGTDAGFANGKSSTPNFENSTIGNRRIVQMLTGNQDAIDAKAAAWQDWLASGHNPSSYQKWSNEFNKTFSPRAFQFARMSPAEQSEELKTMSDADRAALGKAVLFGARRGWFRAGGGGK